MHHSKGRTRPFPIPAHPALIHFPFDDRDFNQVLILSCSDQPSPKTLTLPDGTGCTS